MRIKIEDSEKSLATIQSALSAVNGKATAHTFTRASDIVAIAERLEARLDSLQIPKKDRPGASGRETSGDSVPNCYEYSRTATRVTFSRGSKDWFLVGVESARIYKDGGGPLYLVLTAEQDAVAHEMLRRRFHYSVEKPKAEPKADHVTAPEVQAVQ